MQPSQLRTLRTPIWIILGLYLLPRRCKKTVAAFVLTGPLTTPALRSSEAMDGLGLRKLTPLELGSFWTIRRTLILLFSIRTIWICLPVYWLPLLVANSKQNYPIPFGNQEIFSRGPIDILDTILINLGDSPCFKASCLRTLNEQLLAFQI